MRNFKCSICGKIYTRPDDATKKNYKPLSTPMKVHDQSHDNLNEWIALCPACDLPLSKHTHIMNNACHVELNKDD